MWTTKKIFSIGNHASYFDDGMNRMGQNNLDLMKKKKSKPHQNQYYKLRFDFGVGKKTISWS